MNDSEKIKAIKEVFEFTDLCDCDTEAKDNGEMCENTFACFGGAKQIYDIVYGE